MMLHSHAPGNWPQKLITIVLPILGPVGGAERVNLVLAEQFLKRGYKVELVLAREIGPRPPNLPEGLTIKVLNAPRNRNVVTRLAAYLRAAQPDAVLVGMWPLTVLAPIACKIAGSKARLVLSEHSTLSRAYGGQGFVHTCLMRASMMAMYRAASALVAVSHGVASDLAALSFVSASKLHVINNPLTVGDMELDQESITRAEALWGRPGLKKVLTVGNLRAPKNHALLIRAFELLVRDVDTVLMIVGTGPLGDSLANLRAEAGLEERIVFTGHVDDPSPFYVTADLFVLSSDYEGFGNVIIEAMHFGLPVVSTDCQSGPAEILENGRYGLLTPVGDAMALATAMKQALETPRDGQTQRSRAAEFSPVKTAEKYLALLDPSNP